jgi:hypothetical protein
MSRLLPILVATLVAGCALAGPALAGGGNYAVDGGTRAEQLQVKAALDASSFDFSVVPGTVAIQIERGLAPYSTPGRIVLDAGLLDTGRLSWGVVQHEYAHQVDFSVLDDAGRARLQAALGGSSWCAGPVHANLTCERFADLVSWAYWSSPDNVLKPAGADDEGGQMAPAAFRALLAQLLPTPPVRRTASVSVSRPSPKKVRHATGSGGS